MTERAKESVRIPAHRQGVVSLAVFLDTFIPAGGETAADVLKTQPLVFELLPTLFIPDRPLHARGDGAFHLEEMTLDAINVDVVKGFVVLMKHLNVEHRSE